MHIEIFPEHLVELEQLLNGIAMMKELTKRTQDYLVSFGECMSTRIFAAYLNKLGVKARQVRVLLIAYLNLIHAVTKRLFCFFFANHIVQV
jgi:aspartate kinase